MPNPIELLRADLAKAIRSGNSTREALIRARLDILYGITSARETRA
jgi:hypothetical protein